MRERLAAARRFFRDELQKEAPQLRDAWFPYVIAFGLGRETDKWFRAFGGASVAAGTAMAMHDTSGGGSLGSRSGGGWSGFGGGGVGTERGRRATRRSGRGSCPPEVDPWE